MACKLDMTPYGPDLNQFNEWIGKNYIQNKKTRVIPYSKYIKIYDYLRDTNSKYCAKFRSWVKQRGFCLLYHDKEADKIVHNPINGDLYVSLQTYQEEDGNGRNEEIDSLLRQNLPAISFYRKVAIAEKFYDIIQRAHIDKHGNHAGQKRTYTLVSESYAFLPREAVTYFLLHCATCQPRVEKYGNSSQRALKKIYQNRGQKRIIATPSKFENLFNKSDTESDDIVVDVLTPESDLPQLPKLIKMNKQIDHSPLQSPVYDLHFAKSPPFLHAAPPYDFKKVEAYAKEQFYEKNFNSYHGCNLEKCPCLLNKYCYKFDPVKESYRYQIAKHEIKNMYKDKYFTSSSPSIDYKISEPYNGKAISAYEFDRHAVSYIPGYIQKNSPSLRKYLSSSRFFPY